MNVAKDRLTYHQIHVVWPYGEIRLQKLSLLQEWGEHARVSLQGSVEPWLADQLLTQASEQDAIELWYDDEKGVRCPLFMGQLYDIQMEHAPQEVKVFLGLISHSFKLDTELKNRSFQRVDQQYAEIIDAVLADYPGADKIDEAFGKQATGQFMLQYQETDWTFLKRLASHAGVSILPNTLSAHPQIWIGIPQTGKEIQLEGVPFTLKRNLAPFLDQAANAGAHVRAEDYTRYAFKWDRILQVGDEVHRNHEVYVITRCEGGLDQGLMTWSYECAIQEGLRISKKYNETIIGASIEGKIIEVSRNQVRLHLDLDEQPSQAAQWFPYSAEGNQVWYLMPEKGAQVKLYFPGPNEDDAMVIQSVRTSPSSRAVSAKPSANGQIVESPAERHERKTADPGVKSFANPEGKEISLGNQELNIQAQEGALYISMNAQHGVNLTSTQQVQIQATGDLSLSGGRIQLVGGNGLHLGTPTEKVDLEQQVNSQGTEIQIEASVHQFYAEPLLSEFEQQVADQGIAMVMASRAWTNAVEEVKGGANGIIEILQGVSDFTTDLLDIGYQYVNMDVNGQLGPGRLEHNATQEGLGKAVGAVVEYSSDLVQLKKGLKEIGNDVASAWNSLTDPVAKIINDKGNLLTHSKEESYNAGYNKIKALERVSDVVAMQKGAAGLAKKMDKGPGSFIEGKSTVVEGGETSKPSLVPPRWNNKLQEAVEGLGGDRKLRTNTMHLPLDLTSLESMLQSLASRMDSFSKKAIPVGMGDFKQGNKVWKFEDYSRIDSNRHGGSGGVEKPPKDGKKSEGVEGADKVRTPKPIDPRGEPIKFVPNFKQEEIAFQTYEKLRSTGLDAGELETISRNTGLSFEEASQLKTHVILTEHMNLVDTVNGKYYYKGYFDPDIDIAYGWEKALKGELSAEEKTWFRQLADHELAESKMMQEGLPYRDINYFKDGTRNESTKGAHEIAPPQPGGFPGFKPKF
ncbi:contractile injection system protein, VgrG/Pvc8 family [Paenibacillus senegalimassiliensis]|uniref:contractile injection system protein, VgrG/Pvc8 family n=1 Tax=Paenibacillus senegalimassiliensis TaxID=1737426 RepID=UPI00073F3C0C|nr:contractile injection system protein, VgrG/Pvc8 family [Paenibacillus senegalimassiliensis]